MKILYHLRQVFLCDTDRQNRDNLKSWCIFFKLKLLLFFHYLKKKNHLNFRSVHRMQIVFIMLVWILWLNCIIKVASWADSCKWVFSFSVISKQIYFVMHTGDIIIYQWDVQCPTLVPSNLKMLYLLCCCVPLSQGSQTQLIWGPLESGWGWGKLNIAQKNKTKKKPKTERFSVF